MNSHRDLEHRLQADFMRELEKRAERVKSVGASQITGGAPGEKIIDQWDSNGVHVRQLPDDPQGILRISVGGGQTVVNLNYCSFRGERRACISLLRQALNALENRCDPVT